MRLLYYLGLLVLVVIGLSFAILNADVVTLNYYIGQLQLALSLLLVIALGVGIIIGFLCSLRPVVRCKRENQQLKSRIKRAEAEVSNLRSVPIKDEH